MIQPVLVDDELVEFVPGAIDAILFLINLQSTHLIVDVTIFSS